MTPPVHTRHRPAVTLGASVAFRVGPGGCAMAFGPSFPESFMRMIVGALLIVAASVFFGAGILGMAVRQDRAGFDPGGLGYFVAAVLGLLGLVLLAAGLATDAPRAQGEIQPTPRWIRRASACRRQTSSLCRHR